MHGASHASIAIDTSRCSTHNKYTTSFLFTHTLSFFPASPSFRANRDPLGTPVSSLGSSDCGPSLCHERCFKEEESSLFSLLGKMFSTVTMGWKNVLQASVSIIKKFLRCFFYKIGPAEAVP